VDLSSNTKKPGTTSEEGENMRKSKENDEK
jgi:hypothetical protein